MTPFSEKLLHWYSENKRNLPWRETQDPYHIWISEIILQQTRVEQGLDYYHRFLLHFPSVRALAEASEQEVLKLWQGLGYYSRARNLHHAAKQIIQDYHGDFPSSYAEILKLKGVGEYTAAAISSFAFGLPFPAVDGNVLRITARMFGIFEPINKVSTRKKILEILQTHIPEQEAGSFNQAMMDFGSMQCAPRTPNCKGCCFSSACFAFATEKQSVLPIKEKAATIRDRYIYYLVFYVKEDNGLSLLIHKRKDKDIWQNLFDFPSIDVSEPKTINEVEQDIISKSLLLGCEKYTIKIRKEEKKHLLSHFRIFSHFFWIELEERRLSSNSFFDDCLWVNKDEFAHYPISRLIDKHLSDIEIKTLS